MSERIGASLRKLRIEHDVSQADLAKMIGATQGAVSMWENGTRIPGVDNLIKMADFYKVSLDRLVGRDLPPKKSIQPWELSYSQSNVILTSVESVVRNMMGEA